MTANSSNCLISPGWPASTVEGDSIINATLLTYCKGDTKVSIMESRKVVGHGAKQYF